MSETQITPGDCRSSTLLVLSGGEADYITQGDDETAELLNHAADRIEALEKDAAGRLKGAIADADRP